MHELTIHVQGIKGDRRVPVDEAGVLFVSGGAVEVNGAAVEWYEGVGPDGGIRHLDVDDYHDDAIEKIGGPTLSVGDAFVTLTIYWPTPETLERFPPEQRGKGSGASELFLPIKSIHITEA